MKHYEIRRAATNRTPAGNWELYWRGHYLAVVPTLHESESVLSAMILQERMGSWGVEDPRKGLHFAHEEIEELRRLLTELGEHGSFASKGMSRERGLGEPAGSTMRSWDVFDRGRKIDTVAFTSGMDADEVRRSLISHDGLPSTIEIRPAPHSRKLPHDSPTLPAREFIREKIRLLRHEGRPIKQAIRIAFELARRAGYRSVAPAPRRKGRR